MELFKKKINEIKEVNQLYYQNKLTFDCLTPLIQKEIQHAFQNAKSIEEGNRLYGFFISSGFYKQGELRQLRYLKYQQRIQTDQDYLALLNVIRNIGLNLDEELNRRIERHFSEVLEQSDFEDQGLNEYLYHIDALQLSDSEFQIFKKMEKEAMTDEVRRMNLFFIRAYSQNAAFPLLDKLRVFGRLQTFYQKKLRKEIASQENITEDTKMVFLNDFTAKHYIMLFGKKENELLESLDPILQAKIEELIKEPGLMDNVEEILSNLPVEENIEKAKTTLNEGVEKGKQLLKRFQKASSSFVKTMRDDQKDN